MKRKTLYVLAGLGAAYFLFARNANAAPPPSFKPTPSREFPKPFSNMAGEWVQHREVPKSQNCRVETYAEMLQRLGLPPTAVVRTPQQRICQ